MGNERNITLRRLALPYKKYDKTRKLLNDTNKLGSQIFILSDDILQKILNEVQLCQG